MANIDCEAIKQKAMEILNTEVANRVPLSFDEQHKRQSACKPYLLDDNLTDHPYAPKIKDHIDFSLEAFTRFSPVAQQEFMRAYKAVNILNQAAKNDESNRWELMSFEGKIYHAAKLFLAEEETDMIKQQGIPKHSLAHSAAYILRNPDLYQEFAQKYAHQLQTLEADGQSESLKR